MQIDDYCGQHTKLSSVQPYDTDQDQLFYRGALKQLKQILQMKHDMVIRISTGRRQASWLLQVQPKDLNSGLSWNESKSDQSGIRTRDLRTRSPTTS